MKKTACITSALLLIMSACHTTGNVSNTTPPEQDEAQLAAIKARYPDVTVEQLKQGHSFFYGTCTDCHQPKNITVYSEAELSDILDKMAEKATLSPEQKESVWRYMLAKRLSK